MKKPHTPLRLLRPTDAGWQIFSEPSKEEEPNSPPAVIGSPAEAPAGPVIYVMPASRVISEALWLPVSEEDLVREAVWLQLEVRGLLPPNPAPEQVEITTLRRETSRTLVRADVYPGDLSLPPQLQAQHFLPSPLVCELSAETLAIWREEGNLVLALALAEGVLFWESRSDLTTPEALKAALEIFFLEWESQQLPSMVQRIEDHSGILQSASWQGLPIVSANPPVPPLRWPVRFPEWVPPAVRAARLQKEQKEKILQILQVVGTTLGLIVLVLVGYFTWQRTQLALLEREAVRLEQAAEPLRETARKWEELAGSIEPSSFALERLLLAVRALPGNGVRLSLFEMNTGGLRLEGDARNVGLANLYYNALRAAPGAEAFTWEMAPPALQPDNSAKFAIEATFPP